MSKTQKGSRKQSKHFGDITINDFANATICKSRPKKSNVSVVLKDFERLGIDDKSWDEKPEEYDGEFVQTENEDGTVSYVISKGKERAKKRRVDESYLNATSYNLPIDIWFMIGKFISPEDVGRFSGICKSSYSVVCSAKFWVDLYKKYYKSNIPLPDDLKPDHLKRKFGVRTLTVRTLFFTYKPFADRIHRFWQRVHPKDQLIRRKCVLMWHAKTVKTWSFYFKLEAAGSETHHQRYKNADLIEKLDDVFVNPDENCKVLLVNSKRFIAIPPVQNYTLCDLNISLSNDLLQQRLKLKFSSGVYRSCQLTDGASIIEFTISNVINFKVLDWWYPEYPRTSTLEIFLNGD